MKKHSIQFKGHFYTNLWNFFSPIFRPTVQILTVKTMADLPGASVPLIPIKLKKNLKGTLVPVDDLTHRFRTESG